MTRRPVAAVLVAPGTNRDQDACLALSLAGADPVVVPVTSLLRTRVATGAPATAPATDADRVVADADLIVVPGGFSYADALGAGRLFASELDHVLGDHLATAAASGRPVIGICNGFQVLVRLGTWSREGLRVALGHNATGTFTCEWVEVQAPSTGSAGVPPASPRPRCVWTDGLDGPVACPVAHGEGRLVADAATVAHLQATGRVALTYVRNPNGSLGDIAGLTDATGNVLGLMPHPENHVMARQHPGFHRGRTGGLGLQIFENGVRHARR